MRRPLLAAMFIAVPALAQSRPMLGPADEKAVREYKLTTSGVDKLLSANQRFAEMVLKDPAKQTEKASPFTAKTLDESVKRIEAVPETRAVLKKVGLSPREYVMGTFAMITAAMWSAMIKQYPQAASQMPAEVNRDNLKFIDTHPEIVEKWQGMWEGAGRQGKRAAKAPDETEGEPKSK
jgi:hypothetical protein